jgi:RNA polymerase sigma-70 factor (ECF subfamily)
MDQLSDEHLLTTLLLGNPDALTFLVKRHHRALVGYLDRLVGADWALAQDLAQETFLRVLKQHEDRGNRRFKPWLYAIATNLARDHFKSAAVRRAARLDERVVEARLADSAASPEECVLAAERGTAVLAALSRLGEEYRAALLLRFYGDLSLQEVADTLDIPLGTVKSRLSVGLRRLRELLGGAEEEREGAVR